jgi:branched-chain amino acid aminotransferase
MTIAATTVKETWVWMDGAAVPAEEARVPVLDRGFLYGDSVYEVTRTFAGAPHLLAEHLDRLERSAAGLEMRLPPREQIEAAVLQVCRAARGDRATPDELYLRIVVTRGAGELGLDPALADAPRLVVIARPVRPPPAEAYRDGVAVVLSQRMRSAPSLKTGNYLESVLAVREARQAGAHEALLRDSVGRITEGSSSNVFLVRGGRLHTPPVSAGLLPGITREAIIRLARQAGIAVDEAPIWPADLVRAEEMFLSSSIRGVLPVTRCDGRVLGDGRPGARTRRVMSLYEESTRPLASGPPASG